MTVRDNECSVQQRNSIVLGCGRHADVMVPDFDVVRVSSS